MYLVILSKQLNQSLEERVLKLARQLVISKTDTFLHANCSVYRYGDQAGRISDDGLTTAGNAVNLASVSNL